MRPDFSWFGKPLGLVKNGSSLGASCQNQILFPHFDIGSPRAVDGNRTPIISENTRDDFIDSRYHDPLLEAIPRIRKLDAGDGTEKRQIGGIGMSGD